MTARWAVVIPTVGRSSLSDLLGDLGAQAHQPDDVVVVDDRPGGAPLELAVRVVRSYGRGPAAARNRGWCVTDAEWVVFLDDDVRLPPAWSAGLRADLDGCAQRVGGTQARLQVPLPKHRRPTDWERGTAGLADAAWATADMAYRRTVLQAVSGFDERFPRAYREDADLAVRVEASGWELVRGDRVTTHPVRDVDAWVSVRVQRGNADDALMRARHGAAWRSSARASRGRLPLHTATTLAAMLALVLRSRVALAVWAVLVAQFAWIRIAPGPRDPAEVLRMVSTSVLIPPAAVLHRLRGTWHHRGGARPWPLPVLAVLFDRDGTLVRDVPYNGRPERVRPMPGARAAVARVRAAGLGCGVVSNQSGVARGLLTRAQVDAVNACVQHLLGPFGTWQVCPHGPGDGCDCRKPAPGMVIAAARALGVPAARCAVIGDIGADVEAGLAAGARTVLVPTPATRAAEVRDAPCVAGDLGVALTLLGVGDHR